MKKNSTPEFKTAKAALAGAMQLHQNGDLDGANELYSKTLEIEPKNPRALRLKGILKRENGDIKQSISLLEHAAAISPKDVAPFNELALSQISAGDFKDAEKTLRQALKIAPKNLVSLTNLGALLHHQGHINEAIKCYSTLLKEQPDDINVRCNFAKALVDAGQETAALQACERAINESNAHPYALAIKGAVLIDLERFEEAKKILLSATQDTQDDDIAFINLALCLDELKDTNAAIELLQKALEINPLNARAVSDLANCLIKVNQTESAINLCEGFLQKFPGECLILASYALALSAAGKNSLASELTDYKRLAKTFKLNSFITDNQKNSINTTLAQLIREDRSLLQNPLSKSTIGGSQTGELNLDATLEFSELKNFLENSITSAVEEYKTEFQSTHPILKAGSDQWSLRSWATLLNPGGRQAAHMHPIGWLSGVYYVEIPNLTNEKDVNAGSLLFGPAPDRFSQKKTNLTYHEPIEGQLVLFPSWLWHQTIPFQSNGQRISIAFDVLPNNILRQI